MLLKTLVGGERGVHVWELMYTRGGFMSMYGKTKINNLKIKKKKIIMRQK